MFQGFEQVKDETARSRWFASTGTAVLICAATVVGIVVLSRQAIRRVVTEPPLEVTFRAPPEPETKTEPPPPPPPPRRQRAKRAGKVAPTQPVDVPDETPEEATPTDSLEGVDPEEYGEGGDGAEALGPEPPPPDVPDPEPIHENDPGVISARAIADNVLPIYPEAARKQGREAVVILRIEIATDGSVSSVEIVRGDEPFVTAAVLAVKTWRYEPACVDGSPTAVSRRIKIPFRLHS